MAKNKRKHVQTMHSFFQKKGRVEASEQNNLVDEQEDSVEIRVPMSTPPPQVQTESGRGNDDSAAVLVVEREPGIRCQIRDYPPNNQEQARTAYMKHVAYHFKMDEYPPDDAAVYPSRFQYHWFKDFPWLEYSPEKDAVYCFPCFLFCKKPLWKKGSDVFTVQGFRKWKRVNNGQKRAFLTHMGKDSKSAHSYAVKCHDNFKNKPCQIQQLVVKQTEEDIKKNRLRLGVTIDALRWLAFQACPFRGHDESLDSRNQGNFLEMIKLVASYDEEIGAVVLGNAPGNATYTARALKLVKTRLRNKMEDEFLRDCLVIYIEREIAVGISTDAVIDELDESPRRVSFS